jgi:hypothetical protein
MEAGFFLNLFFPTETLTRQLCRRGSPVCRGYEQLLDRQGAGAIQNSSEFQGNVCWSGYQLKDWNRVIHQHFESATDTTMIKVIAKPSNFEWLATTFMLTGINTGTQTLQQLIVTKKECVLINCIVALIDGGIKPGRKDYLRFQTLAESHTQCGIVMFSVCSWAPIVTTRGAVFFPDTFIESDPAGTWRWNSPQPPLWVVSSLVPDWTVIETPDTDSPLGVSTIPERVRDGCVCAIPIRDEQNSIITLINRRRILIQSFLSLGNSLACRARKQL